MYNEFASVYDALMLDVDYQMWAEYYDIILKKHIENPSLILDLGCGSGNLTGELCKLGYDTIGVDSSPDMLRLAKEKNPDILYLLMNASDFELYGTVDAIVSSLDLVNYITDFDELRKMFHLVNNYLNYGGIFIFDISTPYKLREILGNNTFVYEENDIFYTWENNFENNILSMLLTFFVKEGNTYKRIDEFQTQRAYEIDEIKSAAEYAGLEFSGVYDEFSFDSPKENSQRIFFILQRRKEQ